MPRSIVVPIPTIPSAPPQYDARNEAEFRRTIERSLHAIAEKSDGKPDVKVNAIRSGNSADVTVTVDDSGLQTTAVEFNKREGAGSETGFVDTWDSETGTIGADTALIRTEAVSIPAGLDSFCEWQLTYRDSQGTSHTIGGTVPLPNQASADKTFTIPFTSFREKTSGLSEIITGGVSDPTYIRPNSTTSVTLYASVILPVGAIVTAMRTYMYRGTADDTVLFTGWHIPAGDSPDLIVTSTTPSGLAAWEVLDRALDTPITVAARDIVLFSMLLAADVDPDNTRAQWCEVAYTAPTSVTTI